MKYVDENYVDEDPDGLEFVGAYLTDCIIDDAAWLTVTLDPASFVMEVGVLIDDTLEEVVQEPHLTIVESNNNTSVMILLLIVVLVFHPIVIVSFITPSLLPRLRIIVIISFTIMFLPFRWRNLS